MSANHTLENSIKELQKVTGLPLDLNLTDGQNQDEIISRIDSLCSIYKESYDREFIMKRWLTGDLSESDFLSFAKRFHLSQKARREIYLIQFKNDIYPEITSVLRNTFPDYNLQILQYQKKQLIIIFHFPNKKEADIKQKAYEILDVLNMELLEQATISYGNLTNCLDELPAAFQKAELSLKIGNIFFPDRTIYGYDEMGEGSLLYGISKEVCLDYIHTNLGTAFQENTASSFQTDLLHTANCFLKNNLNIAETARQLHVHRNTLLYRLEQIQNESGLDIRRFDHAMTYKICSLIILYLRQN